MSDKKGIEIKLVRNEDNIFNPWELSRFISEFSNEYYKLELLRTISLELQRGVSPKNIIILSNSIRRKNFKYKTVNLLNKTQFNSFQSIGYPISMYPNSKIKQIALISLYFKRSNEILRSNLNPETLSYSYLSAKNNDFEFVLDELLQKSLEKVLKKGINSGRQNEALRTLKNNLLIEYNKFIKNEIENEKNIIKLQNNEKVYLEEDEKYFNEFFAYFEKNSKPFVGVYIEEENKIKVLCSNHLTNKKKEIPEIDFKRIEHNSPTEFDIGLGLLGVGKSIFEAVQLKKITDEQIKTEMEKQKSEQVAQELMRESIEAERAKKEFYHEKRKKVQADKEQYDDGSSTVEEEINGIPNRHIREKAFIAYQQQTYSVNSFMKRYDIKISELSKEKFDEKV